MEVTLTDNQGSTESINQLRIDIENNLEQGNSVLVQLLQPGVMYQRNNDWLTVVDFMNEWKGHDVRFRGNLVPLKACEVEFTYSNDMFFSGPKLYTENNRCSALLQKLKSVADKVTETPWDLLLGERNENKDLLHDLVKGHPVVNKTFMTYFGKDTNRGHWGQDVVRPKKHTAETLGPLSNRFNTQIRCSDLLDPSIYNQTHYSAMIETTIHNDFAMFSEKEAKPIMAQRPFVIFGSCRQLEAFRSLGFKTFASVIDESYDLIEDKQERWRKALDSMFELSKSDPKDVYGKLTGVLKHNKKHFENNDWPRCLDWDSYR